MEMEAGIPKHLEPWAGSVVTAERVSVCARVCVCVCVSGKCRGGVQLTRQGEENGNKGLFVVQEEQGMERQMLLRHMEPAGEAAQNR